MGSIIWLGFLAFFVASLTVGCRLIWLWRRTHQLPELLIGVGVLGIGPVGFGTMMLGNLLLKRGADAAGSLAFGLASTAICVGIVAKCVFNWKVYHAGSRTTAWAVAIVGALLLASFTYRLLVVGFVPPATPDVLSLAQTHLQAGCLLWGSIEAMHYYVLMGRRERVGLANPVVKNRFLLWSIGAGAAGMGTVIGSVASWIVGAPTLQIPWVVASSSAHGMTAAIALWLAFVPPAAYLRFIQRGTPEEAC